MDRNIKSKIFVKNGAIRHEKILENQKRLNAKSF
jgi:hypothetical protein